MRYYATLILCLVSLLSVGQGKTSDTTAKARPKKAGLYDIIPLGNNGRLVIVGKTGKPVALNVDLSEVTGLPGVLDLKPGVIGTLSQFTSYTLPTAIYDGNIWARSSGTTLSTTSGYGAMLTASVGGFYYQRLVDGNINAKWFGVKGDSLTNDRIAIQKAINYVFGRGGGTIDFQKGKFRSDSTIVILPKVKLKGSDLIQTGFLSDRLFVLTPPAGNTAINSFITEPYSGLEGFSFYYPAQLTTNTTPIQYGWCISTNPAADGRDAVQLRNLMLWNPYQGIRLDHGSQHVVENIYGQPIKMGLFVDRAYDVARYSNMHFWPFHTGATGNLYTWMTQNGIGYEVRHIDGGLFTNIFAYGYKKGIRLINGVDGSPWVSFQNVLIDVSDQPVDIVNLYKGQFTNLTVTGTTVATAQDGVFIGSGVNDIGSSLEINGFEAVNFTNGIRNKGLLRAVISGTSKIYKTNINNGVRWYEIVNENPDALITYTTSLSGDLYKRIAGRVAINGGENFQSLTDITPSGFSIPHAWSVSGPGSSSAISNGSRLSAGVVSGSTASPLTVRSFPIPAQVASEHGLFVFKTTLKANQTAGLNVTKFYIRIRDFSVSPNIDFNILPSAFDAYQNDSTVISVPFVYSGSSAGQIDILVGENITSSPISFDLTNTRLYKVSGYSSSFIERMPKHPGYSGRIVPTVGEPTYPLSMSASSGTVTSGATSFSGLSGTAAPSQLGTGTPSAGKYVDGTGAWTNLPVSSTVSSTTTVQSLRDTWPVTIVSNPTLANVQAAINAAASTGAHIKLAGLAVAVADRLTITSKPNLWLEGLPGFNWTRSDNTPMLEIFGICPNLRISGLSLLSTSSTGTTSVVTTYETAKTDNFEFDHNTLSVPYANANAFGIIQYSSSNVAGSQTSKNIYIHDNILSGVGRMGMEVLAQKAGAVTDSALVKNLRVVKNLFQDLGRVNTDGHGMAASIDGAFDGTVVDSNRVFDANNKTIEIVNTRNTKVRWNYIRNVKNANVTGVAQSAGNWPVSLNLTVTDNDVESTGATYAYFDLQGLTMLRNIGINRTSTQPTTNNGLNLTRVVGAQIQGNTIRNAGYHASMLENSNGVLMTGNTLSTEYAASQLQVVYLYGASTTSNTISGNTLIKIAGANNANYINEEGSASGSIYTNNDLQNAPLAYQGAVGTGVALKLDGQAPDGTSYIVDTSPSPKVVTKWGTPVISSTQAKYGSSSLFINGNGGLSVQNSPDFNFGSGNFTLEGFIYPTSNNTYKTLVAKRNNSGVNTGFLVLLFNDGTIHFFASGDNSTWGVVNNVSFGTPGVNAWSHWAVTRSGSNFYFFLNGVQTATTTSATAIMANLDNLAVGADMNGNPFSGYLHTRITKGTALYTSGFTPPTSF